MTARPHDAVPPGRPDRRASTPERHSVSEVFLVFLRLGLTAFGGPAAHIGYFRDVFVLRRRWLSESDFAALVALSQFLPGPASSQTGFAIGLQRTGGLAGGIAAFIGFTAPGAVIMTLLALGAGLAQGPVAAGALHGLKLAAVAVVAHAVLGMARTLAPDRARAAIALIALFIVTPGGVAAQLLAIAAGLALGLALLRGHAGLTAQPDEAAGRAVGRRHGLVALALFAALFAGLPLLAGCLGEGAHGEGSAAGGVTGMASAFYRAGSLVFGGGHVVLPLLQAEVAAPAGIPADSFLTGYALAQAMPGPMFAFAAWLGALYPAAPGPVVGSLVAVLAIFLPGLLLVYGALPFWAGLRANRWAGPAIAGANAAVVGILAAALYHPLWTSSIDSGLDFALAATGFMMLVLWKAPAWAAAALGAAAGAGLALIAA